MHRAICMRPSAALAPPPFLTGRLLLWCWARRPRGRACVVVLLHVASRSADCRRHRERFEFQTRQTQSFSSQRLLLWCMVCPLRHAPRSPVGEAPPYALADEAPLQMRGRLLRASQQRSARWLWGLGAPCQAWGRLLLWCTERPRRRSTRQPVGEAPLYTSASVAPLRMRGRLLRASQQRSARWLWGLGAPCQAWGRLLLWCTERPRRRSTRQPVGEAPLYTSANVAPLRMHGRPLRASRQRSTS